MDSEVPPAKLLEWDSDFWGRRIATALDFGTSTVDGLAAWSVKNEIDCLVLRLEPHSTPQIHLAEDIGFRLMDIRVDFVRSLDPAAAHFENPAIRDASNEDIPDLMEIARTSHTDTRFYADSHFLRAQCDEFYATWISNSCNGFADLVLAALVDGQPVGYVTGHIDGDDGRIGLIAVAPDHRGRGLGSLLIDAVVSRFSTRGVGRIYVATQGANIRGQKLYQRNAFIVDRCELTFHRWLSDE